MSKCYVRIFYLFNKYQRQHVKFSPLNVKIINSPSYTFKNHVSTTSILFRNPTATLEEVKSVKNNKEVVLIDVREPSELKETGVIPGSINIPLGDVEKSLKDMDKNEFKKKFGIDKPEPKTPIIFSCKLGKRSGQAQDIANKLGYKNVKNYIGGWLEWEEKIK